jgi:hypothetical protein
MTQANITEKDEKTPWLKQAARGCYFKPKMGDITRNRKPAFYAVGRSVLPEEVRMGATLTLHQRNKFKPNKLIDIGIDPPWPIRDCRAIAAKTGNRNTASREVRFWRAFIVASSQWWRRVSI